MNRLRLMIRKHHHPSVLTAYPWHHHHLNRHPRHQVGQKISKKCVEQSIILEASWIGTTNGLRLMIRKHPQPTMPILDTTTTWAATHPPSCSIIKSSQQAHYSIHPPDPLGFVSTDQDLRDRAGHLEWLSQLEGWCRMEKALWVLLPSFAI